MSSVGEALDRLNDFIEMTLAKPSPDNERLALDMHRALNEVGRLRSRVAELEAQVADTPETEDVRVLAFSGSQMRLGLRDGSSFWTDEGPCWLTAIRGSWEGDNTEGETP